MSGAYHAYHLLAAEDEDFREDILEVARFVRGYAGLQISLLIDGDKRVTLDDAEDAALFYDLHFMASRLVDELARRGYGEPEDVGRMQGEHARRVDAIKRRLESDPELLAQIDAYREQYPDDTPTELAERIRADRSHETGA